MRRGGHDPGGHYGWPAAVGRSKFQSQELAIFAVAALLALVFAVTLPGFATINNMLTLARSV